MGSGAREHAIAWKFHTSTRNNGVFCAPGNAGTGEFAVNLDIDVSDTRAILSAVNEYGIKLVFIGPEVPLSRGLADELRKNSIPTVGPGADGAKLESSKAYSKEFMLRHQIPTAKARIVKNSGELEAALKDFQLPLVVKKSGLAAGKGVLETSDLVRAREFAESQLKDGEVVIEEFLKGYEISIFALSDGKNYLLCPPAADYKKAGDGNQGPNTGGMGAVCPVPWFDASLMPEIEETIIRPSFQGLRNDGIDFRGILYFGLMITAEGPKVLEYNVRFGDPEAQAVIPLMETDFANLFEAVANQTLETQQLSISPLQSICVVVAADGYPDEYRKNLKVELPDIRLEKRQHLFHASTMERDGELVTGGGRCFSVVGKGTELLKARNRCYELASQVKFPGAWYRKDIGNRIFGEDAD